MFFSHLVTENLQGCRINSAEIRETALVLSYGQFKNLLASLPRFPIRLLPRAVQKFRIISFSVV